MFAGICVGQIGLFQSFGEFGPRFGFDFVRFSNVEAPDVAELKYLEEVHHLFIAHSFVEIL